MQFVAVLRLLWVRRLAVGLGAIVAIAAGVFAIRAVSAGGSAATGRALARVLVDTNDSQLVAAGSEGVISLPLRAAMLADLMASDRLQPLMAREAGVPASQLDVLPPVSRASPEILTPLVKKAAPLAALAPDPYVLSLYADGVSPVITIEADAPDPTRAATLAGAAISVLHSSLGPQREGQPNGVVVRTLAAPSAVLLAAHSHRLLVAIIGSFATFVLWCAAIVFGSGIARGLRRRTQLA